MDTYIIAKQRSPFLKIRHLKSILDLMNQNLFTWLEILILNKILHI